MNCRSTFAMPAGFLIFALAATSTAAAAQHSGGSAAAIPPVPAEASQFDFLVGEWKVVAGPAVTTLAMRVHGAPELAGTWKAWRAFDGWGIEDELRLSDKSGNPNTLGHSMRAYDPAARHWLISALDPYRSVLSSSVAEWHNGEMLVTGSGTGADGRAYTTRSTFSAIKPASFHFLQERSYDGGRTWGAPGVKIDATRTRTTAAR